VDTTSHDLREYRTRLAERQKPASVNAALAALHRLYAWARDTGIQTNPTAKLKPLASQPLAPQGFTQSNANASAAKRSGLDQWWMRS
jgi:site-specific recombinase XerD